MDFANDPAFEKFKADLFKTFIHENKDKLAQPTSAHDLFMGFIHAVRWTEPWMLGLGAFHLVILAFAIATRRNNTVQGALLVSICGAIYAAQYINRFFASEWRALGVTQNYFDDRGVFITSVYSAPLLCICGFLMLNAFFGAVELLVKLKREQLKRARAARLKAEAAGGVAGGGLSESEASGAESNNGAVLHAGARTRSSKAKSIENLPKKTE